MGWVSLPEFLDRKLLEKTSLVVNDKLGPSSADALSK